MKKQVLLIAAVFVVAMGIGAYGDYTATQGAGTTVFAFVCSTTKVCPASVPINSSNTEIFTSATPAQVSLANTGSNATAINVAQATAASLNATVVGTGTFAVQAAQSGTWNVANTGTFAVQASVPTWAGGTLGAMANYGTSPGAVLVPGVNAFVTNANANGQATMANSAPVTLASNQSVGDPCMFQTKTNVAIATSSGTVQLVAPSGSTQVYVCSFSLIAAATAVVNLVGGTGATCTTGTPVAALGSTTAASGASLAANGGLTFGNGGSTVVRTTTAGHGLCLIQSGTTALAGNITYVQQ